MVENTVLVSHDGIITETFSDTSSSKHTDFTIQKISKTPTLSENETISGSLIRESSGNTNLPREITDLITDSWRTTTRSRYESVLRRWFIYASSRNTYPGTPDLNTVLSFMHGMCINGCLYSGLCAARSALSSIVMIKGYAKLSEHPFISLYLKGIYNRCPPLPKYTSIWDISLVSDYYNSIETNDKLQFKDVVKKTVMKRLILGARRKQALFKITVDNIIIEENKIVFLPNKTLKHINIHRPLEPLIYQGYSLNEKLCIIKAIQCHLGMQENLVDANRKEFIITYGKPHIHTSSDTISRWIKDQLGIAVINTDVYKPHSCRSASTSKPRNNGVSITEILKQGSWKSQNTFTKFYSRDIINKEISGEDFDYSKLLLKK